MGEAGIRDEGLLDSALARPRNRLTYGGANTDIAELAVCYAFGLVKNHPFVDGNKGTAFVVCRTFLKRNGYDLSTSKADKHGALYRLAASEFSEEDLAVWIPSRLVKPQ